jgi:hypothetical protein
MVYFQNDGALAAVGAIRTTIDLEVGVRDLSATLPRGTSGLASGK